MSRTVYVNGSFLGQADAHVSIFDRGLLFADAVYEVVGVLDGLLVDFDAHMGRLARSLGEMSIAAPLDRDAILAMFRELVARNRIDEGLVYLQITRGVAERDYVFPAVAVPTVLAFTQVKAAAEADALAAGVTLASVPDLRWARRDVKTVGLLAQVLAKQAAKAAGADEALMVEDGFVTEAGSSSAYIVRDGAVVTRPLTNDILPGVTRRAVLALAREHRLALDERAFTLEEARAADEAFITAASLYVCPVVAIDGAPVGAGVPGPVVRRLQAIYLDHARESAV